jgi:hypothetical protein
MVQFLKDVAKKLSRDYIFLLCFNFANENNEW